MSSNKLSNAFSKNELFNPETQYSKTEKPLVNADLSECDKKDQPRMISIINRLAQSPLGKETMEIAAENGYKFQFVKTGDYFGYADPENKAIVLNARWADEKLIGTLCHEARHAGQFSRASNLDEEKWDIKTNLVYMRAMEADAQAYASSACEQLDRAGDKGPKKQFYKFYPEIADAFTKALDENNGELGNKLLTDTFKAWYDQKGIKTVYEGNYILTPMQGDLKQVGKTGEAGMTFETSISAEKAIAEITQTKNGSYFTDNPNILNSGKYLDVCENTMKQMNKYFKYRADILGKDDSASIKDIPVRPDSVQGRKPMSITKPKPSNKVKAQKQAIMANKQKVMAGKVAANTNAGKMSAMMLKAQKAMIENR